MANPEHLAILKEAIEKKDVHLWNNWRDNHQDIVFPDLSGVDLHGATLVLARLGGSIMNEANLSGANFSGADLTAATLFKVNALGARFIGVEFGGAQLYEADLRGADLSLSLLRGMDLTRANWTDICMGGTVIVDLDLRTVKGLDTVHHRGPSYIGIDTIFRSQGKIPEVFLRGCGVPEELIKLIPSLVSTDYPKCFISHSSKDQPFIERLYGDLQNKGVRCWYSAEDLKIGDRFRTRIDEAIRDYDKLLIVLSANSIESDWVESEVESAFERERQEKRTVLFPIRLDDAVNKTDKAWAAEIRRTRHIGDFSDWKDSEKYQKSFARLMRDLKV